jgi:hypothetical protein
MFVLRVPARPAQPYVPRLSENDAAGSGFSIHFFAFNTINAPSSPTSKQAFVRELPGLFLFYFFFLADGRCGEHSWMIRGDTYDGQSEPCYFDPENIEYLKARSKKSKQKINNKLVESSDRKGRCLSTLWEHVD